MTAGEEKAPTGLGVVLVDDEPSVLESFVQVLQAAGGLQCRGAYSDPKRALAEIPRKKPAAVLMDIRGPGMSGIECTAKLKQIAPKTTIIMLTALCDIGSMIQSLQAGAGGYLTKDANPLLIPQAIRLALAGGMPLSDSMRRKLKALPVTQSEPAAPPHLSPREHEVLGLMARGLDDKTIAHQLGLAVNSVKSIKRVLFAKLHVQRRSEAILKLLFTL